MKFGPLKMFCMQEFGDLGPKWGFNNFKLILGNEMRDQSLKLKVWVVKSEGFGAKNDLFSLKKRIWDPKNEDFGGIWWLDKN